MKLLHVTAHNVFSINTVDLNLKDRGLTLVTGWSEDEKNGNMAGKSNVANRAIVWGLYGRTVDGIKADDVVNTSIKHAKHCGVTLHFEGIDGEEYRIYRARKPMSLTLSIKNVDEDEWEDLSKRNEKETQELINILLGRDHKTFIQSDFFGQGRERSFLALPGSEQKAVIEEILPLNSLDAWKEKAKQHLADTREELEHAEFSSQKSIGRERLSLAHLHSLESQQAGWCTNNATDRSTAQAKLNEIRALDSAIEDEIAILKDNLPPGKTSEVLQEQNSLERILNQSIIGLGHKIDTLTGDIDRRASRPDICMSCKQTLPEDRILLNQQELAQDKIKREELVKERGEKEAKQYLVASLIAICHEMQHLEEKLDKKEQEARLEENVRLFSEARNPFTALVDLAAWEVQKEKDKGAIHLRKIKEETELCEHYKFWTNAFGSDLKTLVFNQVCPFLEKKANEYLRDLDNGQIKVKFRTIKELKSGDMRDQFCVTAASDTGSKIFQLFSGAEKQLTSFAVGMALSELASMQVEGVSSFMILDEPFLYQSPENCERIINFITTHLVGDKATILLISNEDNLVNLVPNRVHVVKRKGVTSIA